MVAWPRIRSEITLLLLSASRQLGQLLTNRLLAIELELQRIFALYFAAPQLAPRPVSDVLTNTRILGAPLEVLFTQDPRGLPLFAQQLLRLLERSVLAGTMQAEPTSKLAAKVLQPIQRGGVTRAAARRGTVANAWRERFRAITAYALWALVTPAAQRYATTTGTRISGWRWNAILDPRTCAICFPLDGTTAPTPSDFPRGAPPLHPLCRCIVTPIITP
jgi:SPP1 gp7 family putative phage head morphogenesis protein